MGGRQLPRGRRVPARRHRPRRPAVLACLNEIKQRSVLALTRAGLERIVAAAAPAPIESWSKPAQVASRR